MKDREASDCEALDRGVTSAGTTWRLIEPQSMDDATGALRPQERSDHAYGRTDLNTDGVPETFVCRLGTVFCGSGGCDLMLFTRTEAGGESGAEAGGYRRIQTVPISGPPAIVSPDRRNGWSDLVRLGADRASSRPVATARRSRRQPG